MRLRITVRRHGLPETPIIWRVDAETSTVSQLLEQVNEVIPIESGEWGLDDYAVELCGSNGVNFECLHFQPVGKILKDDDEVIIRPLLAQDLKIRKISGRHQISADGKHLVDGLAFGRPLLRRPADRPAINIPPRKRRRIMYNEDEGEDEVLTLQNSREGSDNYGSNNRQLVVHADFEDDDSEEDEDSVPNEDEELDEDVGDAEGGEDDSVENNLEELEEQTQSILKFQSREDESDHVNDPDLADILDKSTRAKIQRLHSAFPLSPLAVCKYVLSGTDGDEGEAYEAMTRGFNPVKPKRDITETSKASPPLRKTRSKMRMASSKKSEDQDSMQVEQDELTDSLLDHRDQNGFRDGSISIGEALSIIEETLQSSPAQARPESTTSDAAVSNKRAGSSIDKGTPRRHVSTLFIGDEPIESEGESDSSSDDSTSSSGSSSSEEDNSSAEDSSSDEDSSSSEDASDVAGVSDTSSSGSDSESSSNSSSDEDATPEEKSFKASPKTTLRSDKRETIAVEVVATELKAKSAAPGEGKTSTQARNKRRRNTNTLNRFKEKGILPAGTTLSEFSQLEVDDNTSPEEASAALEAVRAAKTSTELNTTTTRTIAKADEIEVRRQALFASLASGGIEVGPEPLVTASKPTSGAAKEIVLKTTYSPARTTNEHGKQEVAANAFSNIPEAHQLESTEKYRQTLKPTTDSVQSSASSSRRAKLDLGAGRRLLFGALGIKTPKSKEDEDKLRSDLMKNVRQIRTAKPTETPLSKTDDETADEDPEAWREKITYRAVECCHDGVELSEPPFPFVQRWDPQQQGSWSQKGKRGGKRKKDQRGLSQYYQDDGRAPKKQKQRTGKFSYAEEQEYLDTSYEQSYPEDLVEMQSGDPSQQAIFPRNDTVGKIDQQLINDLEEDVYMGVTQEPDDLAPLPEDPTTLPDLQDRQASPGMTIAFKQLIMSEATKWQPEISAYRTAIVVATLDGNEIQLTLALRDRRRSEKYYDPETGERIYGKFDMPDQNEQDDELEDDGMLNLFFSELVEPKVVQLAPANLDVGITDESDDASPPRGERSTDDSVTLSHENNHAGAQLSHVTETPLHSQVPESNLQESNSPRQVVDYDSPEEAVAPGEQELFALATDADISMEPISEDAKLQISRMMKEAGFRSSVPSSVMGGIRPNGMESPGDAAVFEKLMKDMTEIESSHPYSPKFNGLGLSSPIKKLRRPSRSGSPARKQQQPSSSQVRPSSSWQTVDANELSSPPLMNEDDDSTWQTVNPLVKEPPKAKSKKAEPATLKIPYLGRAQELWEALQPKSRKTSVGSLAENSKPSPGLVLGVDGIDEGESNASMQYPKLSVGSSFTSQISDHGRQPDINFDDSAALSTYTPKVSALDDDSFMNRADDAVSDAEQELPLHKSVNTSPDNHHLRDDSVSDAEPELPRHKSVNMGMNGLAVGQSMVSEILENAPSSDDPFPALEVVFPRRGAKQEKKMALLSKAPTKDNKEYLNAPTGLVAGLVAELSEDEDQLTPTASQYQKRRSNRQKSQSYSSQVQKPHVSQNQTKFVIPQGSQVMDLTMSSDVDLDAEDDKIDDSEYNYEKKIQKWVRDDADDDDYVEERGRGWVPKRTRSLQNIKTRRQAVLGLKPSSQSSLNTSRKSTARF